MSKARVAGFEAALTDRVHLVSQNTRTMCTRDAAPIVGSASAPAARPWSEQRQHVVSKRTHKHWMLDRYESGIDHFLIDFGVRSVTGSC